jgi:CheY-like chemotaxis protein
MSVRDTGVGMEQNVLAHLFEPFFTTKDVGKGAGLGLATVRGIVMQWGGRVLVESAPGEGTAVHLYLPTAAHVPAALPTAPAGSPGRGETILVVEDQAEVRRYVCSVLESCGYAVVEAPDAETAMDALGAVRVDLLLTDLMMPKVGGRDLAVRARQSCPDLKVLYISALSGELPEDEMAAPRSGFLAKPFRPEQLAVKLRQLLDNPRGRARILVVDDEAAVRRLLRRILERDGYEVLEAANGRLAVEQICAGPVDLVITDLVMPEQEGIETIQQLRRDYPALGIIALSGAGQGTYLAVTAALGADRSLAKPVLPELLLAEVERVLEERSRRPRAPGV